MIVRIKLNPAGGTEPPANPVGGLSPYGFDPVQALLDWAQEEAPELSILARALYEPPPGFLENWGDDGLTET